MTTKALTVLCSIQLLAIQDLCAWGIRGHTLANLAAVEAIPADGPVFLKAQKAYIGHLGPIPDTWRSVSEPFLRISEDSNHSWYTEGFDFIPDPPRSRTEFILRVYDEYLRTVKSDPDRAKLLNIRYTGLEAYSIMEGYERMKAGMRLYRNAGGPVDPGTRDIAKLYAGISPLFQDPAQVKQMLANDIAFYMGWVGHYAADAAMPLHDSIHHDGWSGENPKGYTRDPKIHERFESTYVDLIGATEADLVKYVSKTPRYLEDPWGATLKHSLDARNFVEDVYRLDLRGGFENKDDQQARELVLKRMAAGAEFLRDLTYTAWIDSTKPVPPVKPADRPENPDNPKYNPATGSAPASAPTASLDFLNHNRPVLDAHNCYPYQGRWADRIDRALSSGFPVSIEQDLAWDHKGNAGQGRVVLSHEPKTTGAEPLLRDYFFERVRPIVEKALAEGDRSRWPLIVLHFDFKSTEAPLLNAVWNLLGEYESWITTAVKTADPNQLSPFEPKPILVITEDSDEQEAVFFNQVAMGAKLRVFGSAHGNSIERKSKQERIHLAATLPPEKLLSNPPTNYRRWCNNSWFAVEEGGQNRAGDWTNAADRRLRALVDHAHRLGYWIRFYTLDGFPPSQGQGWDAGYNFGSREAVLARWKAALAAGVDFIATDQYEDLGAVMQMPGNP